MTPGFGAETSLYRSSLTYYALGLSASSEHQPVRPAQVVAAARHQIALGIARSRHHRAAHQVDDAAAAVCHVREEDLNVTTCA
jgi:hypothetical protein